MSFRIPCVLLISVFCWSCAQLGSPTGGPRDEDPPVVVESDPPNYSTRFTARKIMITFDEYIVLENVNQELIVSPPLEEKPEVKLRKKTMVIQFDEELLDSTTYTFNFGSAIKDLHEGNKLLNFEYVFSTGDVLDSMSVKGTLKYASDLTAPDEPFSIMLYNDLRDSVPLQDIPRYVGKSDDSGVFSVNNLRPGEYKVFALKDGNNNLLFDLPSEEIAFLDSSLIVSAEFARSLLEAGDSLNHPMDSALVQNGVLESAVDTTKADTLLEEGPDLNSIYIDMMLFTEEPEIQYMTDHSRDDPRQVRMTFARPLTDSFRYEFFIPPDEEVDCLESFSAGRDSLTLWVLDSTIYRKDTLGVRINYTVKDTVNRYITHADTLYFTYREKRTGRRKETEEEQEVPKLKIATIRSNAELDLNREVRIDTDLPMKKLNDSLIRFYRIPDTLEVETPFTTHTDTMLLTRGWLTSHWESATSYRMVLLPGAVQSWYPLDHDTLDVTFRTRDEEYYGQILLNLENVHDRVLVQLISKKEVVREQTVTEAGQLKFPYLSPRDYRIKFIHDRNGNGIWDTGKYLEGRQPEQVEFLPETITVRSNWDHDVTMRLQKGATNPHVADASK